MTRLYHEEEYVLTAHDRHEHLETQSHSRTMWMWTRQAGLAPASNTAGPVKNQIKGIKRIFANSSLCREITDMSGQGDDSIFPDSRDLSP